MTAASARTSGTRAPDSSSLKCGCSASRSSRKRAAADTRRVVPRRRTTVRAAAWVLFTAVVAAVARAVVLLAVVRFVAAKDVAGRQTPAIIVARQISRRHEKNRA